MSDSDIALARRAIALLDLTDLTDDASPSGVARLCERAAEHGTAAVCVWPDFVRQSVDALSGTPVLVATVVELPVRRRSTVRRARAHRAGTRRRGRRDRRRAAVSSVAGRRRATCRRRDRRGPRRGERRAHEGDPRDRRTARRRRRSSVRRGSRSTTAPTSSRRRPARSRSRPRPRRRRRCSA